jgi:hypothetical protein
MQNCIRLAAAMGATNVEKFGDEVRAHAVKRDQRVEGTDFRHQIAF